MASLGLRAWSLRAAAQCLPAEQGDQALKPSALSCPLRSQQGKMPTPGRGRGDAPLPTPNLRRSWEDAGHESWTIGGCLRRRTGPRGREERRPSSLLDILASDSHFF